MSTKSQHDRRYRKLPGFLKSLRVEAELTQRGLGAAIGRPQSWVYNCESGNRRVDIAEFAQWCRGCGVDPEEAFGRFLELAKLR